MHEKILRNGVKVLGSLPSGTGDPILTRDGTDFSVGSVPAIDTATFISTTLPSAQVLVGNGSNVATAVAVTGDIAITNGGVTSIAGGVIVNADVNVSAAIALTKLAATTASRALVSDASGFVVPATTTATEIGYVNGVTSAIQTQLNAKQATITGAATSITSANLTVSRAIVSDGSGKVAVSAATSTEVGYLSGVTSAIQTQLGTKQANVQFKDEGSNIGTSGGVTNVNFVGAGVTAAHAGGTVTVTISGTANGVPAGGTANQYLNKIDGTDYNTQWSTLTAAKITDVTSSAAELNILDGATLTVTELNYVDGVTSPLQAQLDAKQSSSLAQNAMWVGNAGNIAAQLSSGTDGYVLTSVSGAPQWQPSAALSDGDKGDITVSSSGAVWTIDATAVTYAKIQDVAALSLIGRSANTSGVSAAITAASDHNIVRRSGTSIGFGSIDLSQSGAVGSSILPVANGGSGSATAVWWALTGTSTFTGNTIMSGSGAHHTLTFGSGGLELGDTSFTVTSASQFSVFAGASSLSINNTSAVLQNGSYAVTVSAASTYLTGAGTPYMGVDANGLIFVVGSDAIGDIWQRGNTGEVSRLAAVSAGSFLRSGGAATVSAWSTVKLPATISAASIWVANAANTVVEVTPAAGQSVRWNAGGTAWEAYTPGGSGWAVTGSTTITGNTTQTGAFTNTFALNGIIITQNVQTSAWSKALTVTPGAHTGFTASTEFISNDFANASQQWLAGTVTTQRFNYFRGFTVTGASASAIFSSAYTVYIDPTVASTNASISNNYALGLGGDMILTTGTQLIAFGTRSNRIRGNSNGGLIHEQPGLTSSWVPLLTSTPGTHTSMTASTEFISRDHAAASWQWAAGTVTTQRFNFFRGYTLTGASATATFTDAINLAVGALTQGSNAALTRSWSAAFEGNVLIGAFAGTTGSVLLELQSTTKALLLTRATTAGIATKVAGMLWYDSTDTVYYGTNGTNPLAMVTLDTSGVANLGTWLGGSTRSIVADGTAGTVEMILKTKGSSAYFNFETTSGSALLRPSGSATQFVIYGVGTTPNVNIGGSTSNTGLNIQSSTASSGDIDMYPQSTGSFFVRISGSGPAAATGGALTLRGGSPTGGNNIGGDAEILSGTPSGSGAEGSVKIQSRATGKLGFFNTTPVVKQASGANLTNNVTAGGTTDQIDDFTSLTVYATDAAAIRNDIYQLARKLKQVNDALRTYGILT